MSIYNNTKELIKNQYIQDNRPFVITFSGGKDSTLLLHLTLEVILELKNSGYPLKKSFIISSDTKVELPIISQFLEKNLEQLKKFTSEKELNIDVVLVTPKIEESFFSLLIGKGYPSPNRSFRWCTDRLKIRPTLYFFNDLTKKYNSIIMLIGVRKDESQNREKSIESREVNYRGLSVHSIISNAWVFSPIADLTTDEVWKFLTSSKGLWNKDYSELELIYKKGSGENEDSECSLSIDPNSKSCGNSRFGCWSCSVVSEDRSMNGMIKTGENYLTPLYEYRKNLTIYRDDLSKRSSHRKNGTFSAGDFLMEVRFQLLEELFITEKNSKLTLISNDEIIQIQKFWNKDGDIQDKALKLAKRYGKNIDFFDKKDFKLLKNESEKLQDIFSKIYQIEQERKINKNRKGVILDIENSLKNHYQRDFFENQNCNN